MMNYAAKGLNVSLDKNIHVKDEKKLIEIISSLKEGTELYHCYYNLEPRESFSQYEGKAQLVFGNIHFDFDHDDLHACWADVNSFVSQLKSEGIENKVYFSGNKGFHVAASGETFGLGGVFDKKDIEQKVKQILQNLKIKYPTIDLAIWNANRKFRAYGSLNKKSGLYKIEVTPEMEVNEIKSFAKEKPDKPYNPYLSATHSKWALDLSERKNNSSSSKQKIKELNTSALESFPDKKCIKEMIKRQIPGINRHDVGMRILSHYRNIGYPESKTLELMQKWAREVFTNGESDRQKDIERLVSDAYHKSAYSYGCYDDVRKAYCTAKCKLFKMLDPESKAKPIDQKLKSDLASIAKPKQVYFPSKLPSLVVYTETGPVLPSEVEVSDYLIKYFEGRLAKYDGELFLYTGKFWQYLEPKNHLDKIKIAIHALYDGQAASGKVESNLTTLTTFVPSAPQNLFIPNPYAINLNNGTLHLIKNENKWTLEFKKHNPKDWLINLIPIDYDESGLIKNDMFTAMIEGFFENDPDKNDKIKTIKQMYGACLAPIYPHLFLFYGKAGSGKSSIIIPAQKLVHHDNWCSVEPHEFSGFLMESMAGKLVNFVTDIDINQPIIDAHIKKIEDRMPVRIDRKFKTSLMIPLPAIHVFGANANIKTLERGSGAHRRRWTIIKVESFDAEARGNYEKGYAERAFESCPTGVLNFAMEGLKEILEAGGHFYKSEASKRAMKEMEIANDRVALFVEDIKDGEISNLKLGENLRIIRSDIWEDFVEWHRMSYRYEPRFGMRKFYGQFRTAVCALSGVSESKDVVWIFRGIGRPNKQY